MVRITVTNYTVELQVLVGTFHAVCVCLKKNQNAPRPSEHPPVKGEKCQNVPFILDVRLVDVPAGVTQEEGHTVFLHLPSAVLDLIFIARRIQPFLSLVDREVEFAAHVDFVRISRIKPTCPERRWILPPRWPRW